jgi:hypothetical protein
MASNSRPLKRARCYRACDARFPFLWTAADQPPGRWHAAGEGPCHYLATSAKGAWAEVLRHEGITDVEDLVDLERALWEVEGPLPTATPDLGETTLTGGEDSYPACQAASRALRASGQVGLIAPSAAVLSGTAERMVVSPEDGVHIVGHIASYVVVLFASAALVGMSVAEGHPEPGILQDIRHLH